MAKKDWVKVQSTLRSLAAEACRRIAQYELRDEIRDRDLEGQAFVDAIDTPNCDLEVDRKSTAREIDLAVMYAVQGMLEGLTEQISCQRCSDDLNELEYDRKFKKSPEYKAYACAVKAYAKSQEAE